MWKLAVVVVTLVGITSSVIGAAVVIRPAPTWAPVTYETTMVLEQVTRKVYPYSIVPGGAESLDEATRAMRDPGVAAHYTNVDFNKLKQVKLKANLSGYVSYGWGNGIYWTSKPVTLRAGETVFTDGVRLVRARCMNIVTAGPMLPIRPDEPTEQVLDTPMEVPVIDYSFPKLLVLAPELPPLPEELTPTVPIFPPGGGAWFPAIPIIPPIHRHPGPPPL